MQPLVDGFGRTHRDLRISVTDRCNLRCTYCMPEGGLEWTPRSELLSYEEIERVARLCVERLGVDSIRLTGGEPTVRADLDDLVARLAMLDVDLSLTTNGTRLVDLAGPLARAGLRRINVSLDSLRPERFLALTRRDQLDDVVDGIEAALAAGLTPVKVNCVVVRGVNDDEVVDLARLGRDLGVTVRFIEFMPLDASGEWDRDAVVPLAEIVATVDEVFPVEPVARTSEPADLFRYRDGRGEFGVIPSVSRAFCDRCDRIRLTADGELRNCLFALAGTDLRELLRSGSDDDRVEEAIRGCVRDKWAGHGITRVDFVRPPRSMSQIGG